MIRRGKLPIIAIVLVVSLGVWAVARTDPGRVDTWLGISSQTVDQALAEAFDLEIDYGAIVNYVYDDSPAEKAQLRDGDIIIGVNGRKVTGSDDLIDAIEETGAGHQLRLTVLRNGEEVTLTATLEKRPSGRDRAVRISRSTHDPIVIDIPDFSGVYLGVRMIGLSRQLGDYFGVKRGDGALITEVEEGSPAERADLKAGDVIVRIDDEKVSDRSDVRYVLEDRRAGDTVTVGVIRDRQEKVFSIELEERKERTYFGFDGARVMIPRIDIDIPDIPNFDFYGFGRNVRGWQSPDEEERFRRELQQAMEELREELKNARREIETELQELRDRQKRD